MIFVRLIEIKNACLKKKADKIFSTFKCVSVSIYRWYTVNSNLSIQISSSAFNCELLHSTVNLSVPSWEIFSRLAVIVAFVMYRTSSNVTLSTITTSTFDYSCMLFVFKFCISTPFISSYYEFRSQKIIVCFTRTNTHLFELTLMCNYVCLSYFVITMSIIHCAIVLPIRILPVSNGSGCIQV